MPYIFTCFIYGGGTSWYNYLCNQYKSSSCELEPVHGEVHSIQHYVIKFISDFATGRWFSPVSSTNKTDRHDITETLLKVALNTINSTFNCGLEI